MSVTELSSLSPHPEVMSAKQEAKKMMRSLLDSAIITAAGAALFFYSIYICVHQGNFLAYVTTASLGMGIAYHLRNTIVNTMARNAHMKENNLENDTETLYMPSDVLADSLESVKSGIDRVTQTLRRYGQKNDQE